MAVEGDSDHEQHEQNKQTERKQFHTHNHSGRRISSNSMSVDQKMNATYMLD
jgi:hypothetical protein